MKTESLPIKISVRNLFKIFGEDPVSILPLLYDGIDKAELQKSSGHVLALNNINIDILDGVITVIMGLSGSGKSTLVRHMNRLIEPTAGKILTGSSPNTLKRLRIEIFIGVLSVFIKKIRSSYFSGLINSG